MTCSGCDCHQKRLLHLILHRASSPSADQGRSDELWLRVPACWHIASLAMLSLLKESLTLHRLLGIKIDVPNIFLPEKEKYISA